MIIALWAFSFLLMILVTLFLHEIGHLVVSRMTGTKASSFQIGAGPRLITMRSGRTRVRITDGTANLKPDQDELRAGDIIRAYVRREQEGDEYTATAVFRDDAVPFSEDGRTELLRNSRSRMQIKGRIEEITPKGMVVADMEWSLRAFPVMAGVVLNDDPRRRAPEAYNALPWRKQAAITLAGPMANIMTAVIALAMVATFPMGGPNVNTLEVMEVQAGSPAETSGILPGDRILRIGNIIHPPPDELRRQIQEAARSEETVGIGLLRGSESINLEVRPDKGMERIGIRLEYVAMAAPDYPMDPEHVMRRILNMGERYIQTLRSLAREAMDPDTRSRVATGPVTGSYEILRTTQHAGVGGWLIFLATLNLGVAAFNLLPIPPHDGYRVIAEGIQAAQKGKPVSRAVEAVMFIGGTAAVASVTVYLIINDISRLLR